MNGTTAMALAPSSLALVSASFADVPPNGWSRAAMTLKPSNCRPEAGSEQAPDKVDAAIAKATATANEALERVLNLPERLHVIAGSPLNVAARAERYGGNLMNIGTSHQYAGCETLASMVAAFARDVSDGNGSECASDPSILPPQRKMMD